MGSELGILDLGISYYYQDAIKSPVLNFRCHFIGSVSGLYAELSSLDSGSGQNISKVPQSTNLSKHVVRKNMEVKQISSAVTHLCCCARAVFTCRDTGKHQSDTQQL